MLSKNIGLKKHLPLLIALSLLTLVIFLFTTSELKPTNRELKIIDDLLKQVNNPANNNSEQRMATIKNIKTRLDDIQSKYAKHPNFYLLKARYCLLENKKSVTNTEGKVVNPSDIDGLAHIKKAKTLITASDPSTKDEFTKTELTLFEARFLLRLNEPQKTLEVLRTLWDNNPTIPHAALIMSQAHYKLSSLEKNKEKEHLNQALLFVDQALKLVTTNITTKDKNGIETTVTETIFPNAHNHRARIRMRQKKYLDANYDLIEAIKHRPNFAVAHFNRGLCLAYLSTLYSSDPKKEESYRNELLKEVEELRHLNPKLSLELYDNYYLNHILPKDNSSK